MQRGPPVKGDRKKRDMITVIGAKLAQLDRLTVGDKDDMPEDVWELAACLCDDFASLISLIETEDSRSMRLLTRRLELETDYRSIETVHGQRQLDRQIAGEFRAYLSHLKRTYSMSEGSVSQYKVWCTTLENVVWSMTTADPSALLDPTLLDYSLSSRRSTRHRSRRAWEGDDAHQPDYQLQGPVLVVGTESFDISG